MPAPAKSPTSAKSNRTFPREYLLKVYALAVEHGALELSPISQPDSVRFTQSFYRLRRRSDASNASFILPEYHLVTVGQWKQTPHGGALPIYYNKMLDNEPPLPDITPIDSPEPPIMAEPPINQPPLPVGELPADTDEFDVDGYLQQLINDAKGDSK